LRIEQMNWRSVGGYAALLALQFLCGHPQVFWFSAIGQGVFILVRAWGRWSELFAVLLRLLGAAVWAFLLVSIVLLPFLELVQEGNRAQGSMELASFGSFHWRNFLCLFTLPPIEPGPGWEGQLFAGFILMTGGLA